MVFYGKMEYGFGVFIGGALRTTTIQILVHILGNVYLNFGGILLIYLGYF